MMLLISARRTIGRRRTHIDAAQINIFGQVIVSAAAFDLVAPPRTLCTLTNRASKELDKELVLAARTHKLFTASRVCRPIEQFRHSGQPVDDWLRQTSPVTPHA